MSLALDLPYPTLSDCHTWNLVFMAVKEKENKQFLSHLRGLQIHYKLTDHSDLQFLQTKQLDSSHRYQRLLERNDGLRNYTGVSKFVEAPKHHSRDPTMSYSATPYFIKQWVFFRLYLAMVDAILPVAFVSI